MRFERVQARDVCVGDRILVSKNSIRTIAGRDLVFGLWGTYVAFLTVEMGEVKTRKYRSRTYVWREQQ